MSPVKCWPFCLSLNVLILINIIRKFGKVQIRGLKLYTTKGALFQEESYLLRILRSSSWDLHTFHLINIVFWRQIFFCNHGKSTPSDWQDHQVDRRHCDHDVKMQVHESSQPVTCCKAWKPRASNTVDRFWNGCHVDAMVAMWQNYICKNLKITFKLRPSIHNCVTNFFLEGFFSSIWYIVKGCYCL